jgi:hypothetical protein
MSAFAKQLIQDTRQTLLPPHLAAIALPPNNCIQFSKYELNACKYKEKD